MKPTQLRSIGLQIDFKITLIQFEQNKTITLIVQTSLNQISFKVNAKKFFEEISLRLLGRLFQANGKE